MVGYIREATDGCIEKEIYWSFFVVRRNEKFFRVGTKSIYIYDKL